MSWRAESLYVPSEDRTQANQQLAREKEFQKIAKKVRECNKIQAVAEGSEGVPIEANQVEKLANQGKMMEELVAIEVPYTFWDAKFDDVGVFGYVCRAVWAGSRSTVWGGEPLRSVRIFEGFDFFGPAIPFFSGISGSGDFGERGRVSATCSGVMDVAASE